MKYTKYANQISNLLYSAANKPIMFKFKYGLCACCGKRGIYGIPKKQWIPHKSYLLKYRGGIICEACQFAFDDNSDYLQYKYGTSSMKNCCQFIINSTWVPCKRTDKNTILSLLMQQPLFAYIPSRKTYKYIYQNWQPGEWYFNNLVIKSSSEEIISLLKIFSKITVKLHEYTSNEIIQYGFHEYYDDIEYILSYKDNPILDLIVWLFNIK